MRLDKLTTKFQEALADAQSIAVGHDNPYIEPAHVLLAMLRQDDAGTKSLALAAGGRQRGGAWQCARRRSQAAAAGTKAATVRCRSGAN
jgi:ATP-dependent Clp protease ATP-binding subunit ClpA